MGSLAMHWAVLLLTAAAGLWTHEGLTESSNTCHNPKERYHSPLYNDTWKTEEASELLTYLFECYDNRVQPSYKEKTVVFIELYILAIGNFEVRDMNFGLTFYLRERWKDRRLAFGDHFSEDSITLGGNILNQIWRPDTYFVDKKGEGYINQKSFLARINRNGTILCSTQNSITIHCNMDLQQFPMDEQQCNLTIESYGFTVDHVVYHWFSNDLSSAVQFDQNMRTSEFTLGPVETHEFNVSYTTGVYSGLRLVLTFRRKLMYYVIQIYIPSAMIVMLSWISFWIDYKSVPARTALGITTVLAMTTLLFGVQSSLPRVPYIKAVDLFMIVSFACVFAALIEFAVVNYLSTRDKDKHDVALHKYCQYTVNFHFLEVLHYISFSKKIPVDSFEGKNEEIEIKRTIRFIDSFKFIESSLASLVTLLRMLVFVYMLTVASQQNKVHPVNYANGTCAVGNVENGCHSTSGLPITPQNKPQTAVSNGNCVYPGDRAHDAIPAPRDSSTPDGTLTYSRSYCWSWVLSADAIDAYSRIFFPLAYSVFNVVYIVRHWWSDTDGPI